jgi:outer membrane biosynthesis protein TonB
MKIFEIRVDITRQFKQYESDKVGVSAILSEGEDVHEAILKMKKICLGEAVSIEGTEVIKEEVKQMELPIAKEEPKVKKEVKKETKKVERPKVEEPKAEEVKEEVKEEEPKVKKEVKKPVSKNIAYDRANDLHKKHVGTFLDSKYPTWRKDEKVKSAAVTTSQLMAGKDFMSASGTVLPEFVEQFCKSVENALRS